MYAAAWTAALTQVEFLDSIGRILDSDAGGSHTGITRVVFCGHSLGAAVALLLALMYTFQLNSREKKGIDIAAVTFGSPAIGDAALQEYVLQVPVHKRFYVEHDPVAGLPRWTCTGLRFCGSAQQYAETQAREHWALSPRGRASKGSGAAPAIQSLSVSGLVYELQHNLQAYALCLLRHFRWLHAVAPFPAPETWSVAGARSAAPPNEALGPSRPAPSASSPLSRHRLLSNTSSGVPAHGLGVATAAAASRSTSAMGSMASLVRATSRGMGTLVAGAFDDVGYSASSSAVRMHTRMIRSSTTSPTQVARSNVDKASSSSTTPLHGAASAGKTEAAATMLAAGAPVDAIDSAGRPPLHEAASWISSEATTSSRALGADVDRSNVKGRAPLQRAASSRRFEAV